MGPELIDQMRAQAQRFGADTRFETGLAVDLGARPFRLETDAGEYRTDALIIATGASARQLGLASEAELMGYGSPPAPPATASSSGTRSLSWWAAATRRWRKPRF